MAEVSVIVPVYKIEKYLCRCIDSILAQTFQDFELLLINDGSPDNSGAICDEYAEKDLRVRVFHKDNEGAASARNYGLDRSSASWILFVDGDDYIDSRLLEEVIQLQKKHTADIVEFGITFSKASSYKCHDEQLVSEYIFTGKDMLPRIYQNCPGGSVYPVNKLFKKDLFENVRFQEGRINEDTIIAPMLYHNAKTVVVTSKIYYYYYLTEEDSVTRSSFSLKKLDSIYAYSQNRQFYEATGAL